MYHFIISFGGEARKAFCDVLPILNLNLLNVFLPYLSINGVNAIGRGKHVLV